MKVNMGLAGFICLAVLSLLCVMGQAMHVPELSFSEPFEDINSRGDRIVSKEWSHGGDASVLKHFVRLTPDRVDKRGWMWNRGKLSRDEFSIILRFRISGRGKRWFGDGIGLWITQEKFYKNGELHGFTDKYKGVGVIFDTFKNVDHKSGHKDVSVYVNPDGSKRAEDFYTEKVQGCNAKLRYHEESAAFSTSNHSRALIRMKGNSLKIDIDPQASGEWEPCYEAELEGLPAGWYQDATLGLTASTGGLADNHDILALDFFTEFDDSAHKLHDSKTVELQREEVGGNTVEARLANLELRLERMFQDFEHTITSLREYNKEALEKLREQERGLEKRTKELEKAVRDQVSDSVMQQFGSVTQDMDSKLEETVKKHGSSSWKLPFALLVLGLIACGFFVYKKYVELRKSHLL